MTAFAFIVQTVFELYILTFILRVVLQAVRSDFYNPISQFVVRVTDPLVVPLRRIIPVWRALDLASVAVILLLEAALITIMGLMSIGRVPPVSSIVLLAVLGAVKAILQLFLFAIFVRVILSWVNPGAYNPIIKLLHDVTEPLLRPARRLIPPIGGLDLSPLVVLIGLQALLLLVVRDLFR